MIQKQCGGSIVNVASVAATRGTPTMCAYVASKAAVLGCYEPLALISMI